MDFTSRYSSPLLARFIAYFLIVGLLLVAVFAYVGYRDASAERAAAIGAEKVRLEVAARALDDDVEDTVTDVRVLARSEILHEFLADPTQENRRRLERQFVNLARLDRIYDQIRFIDAAGYEQVRVNFNQGDPVVVPRQELQDKSGRYYFRESIVLEQGQVYLSPLDLNIEQGVIELPYKPMIRVATPVFDAAGELRGVVVLNYLAQILLDGFTEIMAASWGKPMILNQDGYWLYSPDEADRWGFMFDNERTFAARYPQAWAHIGTQRSGVVATSRGVFVFETVRPYELPEGAPAESPAAQEYVWKLVSLGPPPHLLPALIGGVTDNADILALLLVVAAVLSFALARLRIANEVKAEALRKYAVEIEDLYNNAPCGYHSLDKDGVIVQVNDTELRWLGYNRQELVGKKRVTELFTPASRERFASNFPRFIRDGVVHDVEYDYVRKDGSVLAASISALAVYDEHGNYVQSRSTLFDITERKQIEAQLRETQRRMEQLLASLAEGVFGVDLEGRCTFINAAGLRLLGYDDPLQVQGKHIHELIHHTHLDGTPCPSDECPIYAAFRDGMGHHVDNDILWRSDGTSFDAEYRSEPIVVDGAVHGAVASFIDITARKQAERALRDSEQMLAEAQRLAHLGNWVWDIDAGRLSWSDESYRIFGIRRGETPTYEAFMRTVHPEDHVLVEEAVNAALYERAEYDIDHRIVRPDGSVRFVHERGEVRYDQDGRPVKMIGTVLDITERKEAERALRESEQMLAQAQRVAHLGNWVWDIGTGQVVWSEESYRIYGVSRDETPSYEKFMRTLHPEDRERVAEAVNAALYEGAEYDIDHRVVKRDGSVLFVHARGEVSYDKAKRPVKMIGTVQDITERKEAEEALRRSEERFRELFEQASDGVFIADFDGRYTDVNSAGCNMLGYARDEIVGKTILDLIPPSDIDRLLESKEKMLEGRSHVAEWTLRRKDGAYLPVEVSARILADGRWQGFVRDISERKQAERALRDSEERFRLITETIQDVFWMSTPGIRQMLYVSPAYERVWGRSRASLYAAPQSFLEAVHPEDRARLSAGVPGHARGQWEYTYRVVRPDGSIRWVSDRGFPIYDEQGQIRLMTGVATDITERREAEIALRDSEERFRLITETIHDAYWISTPDFDQVLYISPSYEEIWGRSRESLYQAPYSFIDAIHPDDKGRVVPGVITKARWMYEFRVIRPDGSVRWVQDRGFPVFDADGSIRFMTGAATDITERKEAEERLRQAATVFENTTQAILITDPDARIISTNRAFTVISGYTEDEARGQNPRFQQSAEHSPNFFRDMWAALLERGHWEGEIWNRRKNGEVYPTWQNITAVKDDEGRVASYVAVISDISALKEAEARMAYLAHHDALTGLPNRLLFTANLDQAIEHAKRNTHQVAVMFLDLDRFKIINDTLGHASGDQLLRTIASRLRKLVRAEDTVARLGGDEFTVILTQVAHADDAALLAERIIETVAQPVAVDGHEVITSTSIGISVYPEDARNSEDLIKAADAAMYRAKERGRNTYRFYKAELTRRAFEHLSLEHGLRRALERDEFVLHFQPQVALATGRIVGVEALIRWMHPEEGLIPPGRFIGLAEETGLIEPIGEWVLRAACSQAGRWREQGLPAVRLAVNLSGGQVMREGFLQRIENVLRETGVYPGGLELELEITESLLQTAESSIRNLERLKAMGVGLSIDDFGTGYSSLSHLKFLPVDSLKIDRSFVSGIPADLDDQAIATAVITMAHTLGMKVVGEGVETIAQLDFLRERGCDEVQGYLLSPSMPPTELARLLAANKPVATLH